MLNKQITIDQITVTENGIILVRQVTRIIEDGNEISKAYHRTSFIPGQDVSDQPENVQNICNVAWTPEVIAAYQDHLASSLPNSYP